MTGINLLRKDVAANRILSKIVVQQKKFSTLPSFILNFAIFELY